MVRQLGEVTRGQHAIVEETGAGAQAVERARSAIHAVGGEVSGIVATLRDVSKAAGQITKIALQTRLVAFNASVEAKRAGEAGRGFSVVADAVRELASKVDESSRNIMETVGQLDARVEALAREIQRQDHGQAQGAVHQALDESLKRRLHLLGFVSPCEPYLAAADFYVLPSYEECMSLAMLDAAIMGLPIVGTNSGGTPSVVRPQETGELVPPRDARALGSALEAFFADPEQCRRLGAAARELGREFDREAIFGRIWD